MKPVQVTLLTSQQRTVIRWSFYIFVVGSLIGLAADLYRAIGD